MKARFSESPRPLAKDPKRWLSAQNYRAIARYPRAIDFRTSNRQNEGHLERVGVLPLLTSEPTDVEHEYRSDFSYRQISRGNSVCSR